MLVFLVFIGSYEFDCIKGFIFIFFVIMLKYLISLVKLIYIEKVLELLK